MKEKQEWRKEKRKTGGSIRVIKGKIFARIQYLDETTGKRKEKLREAPNRTKAREFIKDMRKELEQGGQMVLESDKLTFQQIADKYQKIKLVPPVFQNGIKVTGKRSYQDQIYLIKPLKEFFGRKVIRSIKPSDLEAYKTERIQTPVVIEKKFKKENPKKERRKFIWVKEKVSRQRTIASVNRELSLLRQIFVFAESEDFISRNPFAKAKKIISTAAEVERDRILSFEEEIFLLEACNNDIRKHLIPLIITAVDTAMRKGELLKLIWQDVNFDQEVITVRATNTKTEKMRVLGMTSRVKRELSRLWQNSPQDKKESVYGLKSNFKRSWRTVLNEAGINDLHFHDLRHTAITRMVRAGIPASEVMKISGHTEMKTFQRYVNLTNESVCVSANKLESFYQMSVPKSKREVISELLN
jgi:integrase